MKSIQLALSSSPFPRTYGDHFDIRGQQATRLDVYASAAMTPRRSLARRFAREVTRNRSMTACDAGPLSKLPRIARATLRTSYSRSFRNCRLGNVAHDRHPHSRPEELLTAAHLSFEISSGSNSGVRDILFFHGRVERSVHLSNVILVQFTNLENGARRIWSFPPQLFLHLVHHWT